jgi:hypothetical protein
MEVHHKLFRAAADLIFHEPLLLSEKI